jgi:hypothetical protein
MDRKAERRGGGTAPPVAFNLSAFISSGYIGASLIIFGGSPSVNGSAATAVQIALSPGGSESSQRRTRTRLLASANQSQSVEVVLSNPSSLHYVDPPPENVTVRCTPTAVVEVLSILRRAGEECRPRRVGGGGGGGDDPAARRCWSRTCSTGWRRLWVSGEGRQVQPDKSRCSSDVFNKLLNKLFRK